MEMAPSRVSNPLVPLISAEEHAASLARARAARGAAARERPLVRPAGVSAAALAIGALLALNLVGVVVVGFFVAEIAALGGSVAPLAGAFAESGLTAGDLADGVAALRYAKQLGEWMGCANSTGCGRLVDGGVPLLVQSAMHTDFAAIAGDVSALGTQVVDAMKSQYAEDIDLLHVERYARIAVSVADQAAKLPALKTPVSPGPRGDVGVVNVLGYLMGWVAQQLGSITDNQWRLVAESCKEMATNVNALDLSDHQYWDPISRGYREWSVGRKFHRTVDQVGKYCEALADLQAKY